MAARRTRLTTRGRILLPAVALLLIGGVVYVAFDRSASDCTAEAQGRTVAFNRSDAENVSTAVAAVVRRSGDANAARSAVLSELDIDPSDAETLAAALTGQARAALVCEYGGADSSDSDSLDASGLTGRAAAVRTDVEGAFGDLPLGGFAAGGVSTGHMPGSAHYDGRALDIFFRPINAANKQHGWAVAQYLVAHAARLEINTVIFDGRIWTARRAGSGWRDYDVSSKGRSAATVKILEHRDHVHVDVAD